MAICFSPRLLVRFMAVVVKEHSRDTYFKVMF